MKESLSPLRNYNKASCILGFGPSFAASTPPGPAVSLASPLRLCLAQRSRVHHTRMVTAIARAIRRASNDPRCCASTAPMPPAPATAPGHEKISLSEAPHTRRASDMRMQSRAGRGRGRRRHGLPRGAHRGAQKRWERRSKVLPKKIGKGVQARDGGPAPPRWPFSCRKDMPPSIWRRFLFRAAAIACSVPACRHVACGLMCGQGRGTIRYVNDFNAARRMTHPTDAHPGGGVRHCVRWGISADF